MNHSRFTAVHDVVQALALEIGGQAADAFVKSLYKWPQYCEFGQTKDKQIRDRIVIGVHKDGTGVLAELTAWTL